MIVKSLKDHGKMRTAEAITLGFKSGIVIVLHTVNRLDPNVNAASSRDQSTRCILPRTTKTAKGKLKDMCDTMIDR